MRGPVVVGDLAGVHLVGEPDALLVEHVQDRVPPVGEVLVARGDHRLGGRREHRDVLPDRRAGEAHDGVDAEHPRRPGGVLHLLGRPLPDALGIAVAPHPGREDAVVALVDGVVAHGLAGEVVGDRVHLQAVTLEDVEPGLDVVGVLDRGPRVEVVAPAGDLEAVVAPAGCQRGDLLERQIGPLAGEQRDRTRHDVTPVWWVVPSAELASTAARTRCTARPSANEGIGSAPLAMSVTKSTTWWVKPCS